MASGSLVLLGGDALRAQANALDLLAARETLPSIFATAAYREFLSEVTGVEAQILALVEGDHVEAFIPFFERAWGKYRIANSQPFFGSHGAIVGANPDLSRADVERSLLDGIWDLAKERGWASLTVIEGLQRPIAPSALHSGRWTVFGRRLGQLSSLIPWRNQGMELPDVLHSKTRNAIRKGRRSGATFREVEVAEQQLVWLQRLHAESISGLGGQPKSLEVFRALMRMFRDSHQLRLFVAEESNDPVAGVLTLTWRSTVEYFTPVIDPRWRSSQVLSALLAFAMNVLAQEGFGHWNWGGTWQSQESVYRFKNRWGSTTLPYRYLGQVGDPTIWSLSPNESRNRFPYFFVRPFDT